MSDTNAPGPAPAPDPAPAPRPAPLHLDAVHSAEARASLRRLEHLVREGRGLRDEVRAELRALTEELAHALEPVLESEGARVRSVTQFAEAAAHEAARPSPDRGLLDLALQGLERALSPFEGEDARFRGLAGRIAQVLSDVGI